MVKKSVKNARRQKKQLTPKSIQLVNQIIKQISFECSSNKFITKKQYEASKVQTILDRYSNRIDINFSNQILYERFCFFLENKGIEFCSSYDTISLSAENYNKLSDCYEKLHSFSKLKKDYEKIPRPRDLTLYYAKNS